MPEKREKPPKAETTEKEEKEQKPSETTPPGKKDLTRSELEALRQSLQRKFHR